MNACQDYKKQNFFALHLAWPPMRKMKRRTVSFACIFEVENEMRINRSNASLSGMWNLQHTTIVPISLSQEYRQ
jgi:hypothetical protein